MISKALELHELLVSSQLPSVQLCRLEPDRQHDRTENKSENDF
jgi:hypothetical protein